ncbi:MAG: putative DNA modification/repair radical SAM protein [Planctomycetota bacterium]
MAQASQSVPVKLRILADAAKYDASCSSSGARRRGKNDGGLGNNTGVGICHSYTPDGRCVSLLKILLTNYCIYDCKYCVNRVSSDVERARFMVDEVVNLTLDFYKRNYIEGLFLSSGIIRDVDYTMEQLIAVAKTLRSTHKYNGYIHLKAVPLASPELLAEAGRWADRLSANIEMPRQADLDTLAPEKKIADADATMATLKTGIDEAKAERKAPKFAPAGQSTQMIVGATAATDADILDQSNRLYSEHQLKRVYYSAFSPIPHGDDRLPLQKPPLVREHRLYQSDWLLRFYGFRVDEITTKSEPNLPLEIDPKLAWALRNRAYFPVNLNTASPQRMLRVPGLGKRTVGRILKMRRWQPVRSDDLQKLRVSLKKVLPWVVVADRNPATKHLDADDLKLRITKPKQLELFDLQASSLSGEV